MRSKNERDAPPFRSNIPVIIRYASVGRTGNVCPPKIKGVAKSAREAPNRSKIELPIPGRERGMVMVRNILQREEPKESAASSRFALIVLRTAVMTIKATGK